MQRVSSERDTRTEHLRRCALFEGLDDRDLVYLADACHLHAYDAGELIFRQNEPAEGFHVVAEGRVRIYRTGGDGREQTLHVYGPGQPCGEVPVFAGGRFPASLIAEVDTRTLYLSREAFLEAAQRQPEVLMDMLSLLARRLRHFVEMVDDLALKDVSARLARYLLELSQRESGASTVLLPTSKAVLASRLGTIAETLSRTFRKMREIGVIDVQGNRIELLDRSGLQALADGAKL